MPLDDSATEVLLFLNVCEILIESGKSSLILIYSALLSRLTLKLRWDIVNLVAM